MADGKYRGEFLEVKTKTQIDASGLDTKTIDAPIDTTTATTETPPAIKPEEQAPKPAETPRPTLGEEGNGQQPSTNATEEIPEEDPNKLPKDPDELSDEIPDLNRKLKEDAETTDGAPKIRPEDADAPASPRTTPPPKPGNPLQNAEAIASATTDPAEAAKQKLKQEASKLAAKGIQSLTAATGGTCWIVGLVIVGIILILVIIFSVIMCAQANRGDFGSASPIPAGKDSQQVKDLLAANSANAKNAAGNAVAGFNQVGLNNEDKKFVEDGLIDKRLAEVLKYLSDKHLSLGMSHVVSGYSNMAAEENPESGAASNSQVNANVSAHKIGTAADLSKIDFVYKTIEINGFCCEHCPKTDVVYYGDAGMKIGSQTNAQGSTILNPEEISSDDLTDYASVTEGLELQIESLKNKYDQLKALLNDPEFLKGLSNEQLAALKDKISKINTDVPGSISLDLNKINELNTINQQTIASLKERINKTAEAIKNSPLSAEEKQKALEALGKMELMVSYDISKWSQYTDYISNLSNEFVKDLETFNSLKGLDPTSINIDDLNWSLTSLSSSLDGTIYAQNIGAIQDITKLNEEFVKISNTWDQAAQAFGGLENPETLNKLLGSRTWTELPTNLGNIGSLGNLANLDMSKLGNLGGLLDFDKLDILGNLGSLNEMDKIIDFSGLGNLGDLAGLGNIGLGGLGGITGTGTELLRIRCTLGTINTNTTWGAYPAEAIPIKVSWQDRKPNVKYVSGDTDDSLTTDPRIYYSVYQPEARRKTHQVISELLAYPVLMKNLYYYRINQLITFSDERDVRPFWNQLKEIYGLPRRANLGLFAMPESWAQVHIGY